MIAATINKFGDPDVFEMTNVPMPSIEEKDVLIKIYATSINPIDFKSRKGNHRFILGAKFPIVLGYDIAGEVVETGPLVKDFKIGDKVYGRSDRRYGRAYAQYGATSEQTLSLMPRNISYKEAAAVPLAGLTALQALRDKCNIQKDNKVLIIGATGGVGHFAVQLANYYGADCTAVCSSLHQEFIKSLAPNKTIDYTRTDYKNTTEKYDIIFDVAGKESFLTCKHLLSKNGIYITNLPRPKILIHYFVSLFTNGRIKTLLMHAKHKDLDYMKGLIEENIIIPHVEKSYKLEEISIAHKHAEKGHTEGKIIISVSHG